MKVHVLKGCAPAPLANYLKALGILRLVGEQTDPQVRGWWDGEQFCLLTKLSKEELGQFFLERYEPTPLVAPWNGGSGFFKKDNRRAIQAIVDSPAKRMQPYRRGIQEAQGVLGGLTAKPEKELKLTIQQESVKAWRGKHRAWLDAAFVLDVGEKNIDYPSLLGTGGNDGRLDFTNNYMQQLCELFDMASSDGAPLEEALELLGHAFWQAPVNNLVRASVGQYQPGAAGGANSSTGFASGNLVNPWDFVLMMEGSLLFTSRATKRLNPAGFSRASAPFVVRSHATGFSTPGAEKAGRGEQWMPLWSQPAGLQELTAMYGEARVQLARQVANRPVDMARAIGRLGVARGIDAFVRYGYLERNGQATLAVPLGRVQVRQHPRAYLVDDLAAWLDRLQRCSRDKNAPARLGHAEHRLADAVFAALTHDDTPNRWQEVLRAASDVESLQATGTAIEAQPIPSLRPEWISATDDGSVELRLALALGSAASFYRKGRPIDSIRHHWLPLERGARQFKVADKRMVNDPRAVATGRDAIRDLAATVERRLIESGMDGQHRLPLVAAPGCGARLDDLAAFLAGALDLDKLLGLARAFMALRWEQWRAEYRPRTIPMGDVPDETWLALRLTSLAWPLSPDRNLPAEPRIVRLLLSGDVPGAVRVANARLRSAGIRSPVSTGVTDSVTARRWAAALAFPIHRDVAIRAVAILDPSLRVSANV